MKKTLWTFLGLLMASASVQAAPYYVGPGCNAEGTKCLFGKPSGRVMKWSKKGTIDELGARCEKFLSNIENRKNEIAKTHNVVLKYKDPVAYWSRDVDENNGQAKIVCSVELHSELPNVKLDGKIIKKLFWVCENEDTPGVCAHYERECEAARDEALKDKEVLDATIYRGASLVQGSICEITTVKFKEDKKSK